MASSWAAATAGADTHNKDLLVVKVSQTLRWDGLALPAAGYPQAAFASACSHFPLSSPVAMLTRRL